MEMGSWSARACAPTRMQNAGVCQGLRALTLSAADCARSALCPCSRGTRAGCGCDGRCPCRRTPGSTASGARAHTCHIASAEKHPGASARPSIRTRRTAQSFGAGRVCIGVLGGAGSLTSRLRMRFIGFGLREGSRSPSGPTCCLSPTALPPEPAGCILGGMGSLVAGRSLVRIQYEKSPSID